MGSLFDVIANVILFYPRNDMKLKHHIAKLSELEWFEIYMKIRSIQV